MGFFLRFGRPSPERGPTFKTVTRTEVHQIFKIKVPKDRATSVQRALEAWAQSKGWAAVVNASPVGDNVEFTFQHDESSPGRPPDIAADGIADDLRKVLEDSLKARPA